MSTYSNHSKECYTYEHEFMSYYCDCCYKTIKFNSKHKHFKCPTHKEFDKCQHKKLTINNPDINEIGNTIYKYIIEHNKKYKNYVIYFDFILDFNNIESYPHLKFDFLNNKIMFF